MPKVQWDADEIRRFETGIDRGMLYLSAVPGVPWNGLAKVSETPVGGTGREYFIDGEKYLNTASLEEYSATVEAFSCPVEFAPCAGLLKISPGLFAANQPCQPFGFSYRTLLGDNVHGTAAGYKIHIVYNALARIGDFVHETVGSRPNVKPYSWTVTAIPEIVSGFRPASHFVIDSRKYDPIILKKLEDILYGTEMDDSRLPSAQELMMILNPELNLLALPPAGKIYLGTWTTYGIEARETLIGRKYAIQHHYYGWSNVFPGSLADQDWASERLSLLTWQPAGTSNTQLSVNELADIAAGVFDSTIDARAADVAAWGHPVFVRFGHEMNGTWYPWSGVFNPTNQLTGQNTNFDGGTGTWIGAGNCTTYAASSNHTGTGSIGIQASAAAYPADMAVAHCTAANILAQGIACSPGDKILVPLWTKAGAVSRSVKAGAGFYDASGAFISDLYGSSFVNSTTEWKQIWAVITAPNNAAKYRVRGQVLSVASAGEVHYIDDVLAGQASSGPANYVAAYRRVVDRFRAAGASNAIWVWSPNVSAVPGDVWNDFSAYDPGPEYVDWVGIDGYNWGTTTGEGWKTFATIFNTAGGVYQVYQAEKPVMICEVSSAESGGNKASWITAALATIKTMPGVKAIVWFDAGTEFPIDSSSPTLTAYKTLAADDYLSVFYGGTYADIADTSVASGGLSMKKRRIAGSGSVTGGSVASGGAKMKKRKIAGSGSAFVPVGQSLVGSYITISPSGHSGYWANYTAACTAWENNTGVSLTITRQYLGPHTPPSTTPANLITDWAAGRKVYASINPYLAGSYYPPLQTATDQATLDNQMTAMVSAFVTTMQSYGLEPSEHLVIVFYAEGWLQGFRPTRVGTTNASYADERTSFRHYYDVIKTWCTANGITPSIPICWCTAAGQGLVSNQEDLSWPGDDKCDVVASDYYPGAYPAGSRLWAFEDAPYTGYSGTGPDDPMYNPFYHAFYDDSGLLRTTPKPTAVPETGVTLRAIGGGYPTAETFTGYMAAACAGQACDIIWFNSGDDANNSPILTADAVSHPAGDSDSGQTERRNALFSAMATAITTSGASGSAVSGGPKLKKMRVSAAGSGASTVSGGLKLKKMRVSGSVTAGAVSAFVQQVSSRTTTAITVALTVGTNAPGWVGPTTAGNKLVLGANTGSGGTVLGIVDSRLNTWVIDKQGPGGSGGTSAVASTVITTPLVAGDTITLTLSASVAVHAGVVEVSGIGAADQSATHHVTTTSDTVATTANSQTGGMVFVVGASAGAASTLSINASDPDSGGTWTDMQWPYATSVAGGADIGYQIGSGTPCLYSATVLAPTALNMDATIVSYLAA